MKTVLHTTARQNNVDLVELLLRQGVDIKTVNKVCRDAHPWMCRRFSHVSQDTHYVSHVIG